MPSFTPHSGTPCSPGLLSLRTPILIEGPLRHPDFSLAGGPLTARSAAIVALAVINPLAAVLGLVETGPGEEGACGSVKERLTAQLSPY